MKLDVIILAGGLGTRLQSVVADVPKPMAPVCDSPFIHYILKSLDLTLVNNIIFSVGYKHEVIKEYIGDEYEGKRVLYAVEDQPLGTGGGIKLALQKAETEQVLILNGDTYFQVDIQAMLNSHIEEGNTLSLALKYINKPARYGTVITMPPSGRIIYFKEKNPKSPAAFINGGVYIAQKELLEHFPEEDKCSFEQDILEKHVGNLQFGSFISAGLFIDIGIPEDYEKAQELFQTKTSEFNWSEYTLFLDRDGVINAPRVDDYVKNTDEFELTENALEAIQLLNQTFKRIYVVTNQQGIDRQLMTVNDLEDVHLKMYKTLKNNNVTWFNQVFYAPYLRADNHPWRKPKTGMIEKAKMYQNMELSKSVMVGDSPGDMELASKIGALKVRISNPQFDFDNQDMHFDTLYQFALYITQI
ncbi:MAG: HAD-IIIA family hydrolase [Bacteroidia bacterium]